MRNQEIELIEDERVKLKKEIREYEGNFKVLQESNRGLVEEVERQKEEVKRLGVDKKKLESERGSLIKKISFLEKINFST